MTNPRIYGYPTANVENKRKRALLPSGLLGILELVAVDALLGYVGAKELYITGQVFPWQIDFYCFMAIVSRGYVPWPHV